MTEERKGTESFRGGAFLQLASLPSSPTALSLSLPVSAHRCHQPPHHVELPPPHTHTHHTTTTTTTTTASLPHRPPLLTSP